MEESIHGVLVLVALGVSNITAIAEHVPGVYEEAARLMAALAAYAGVEEVDAALLHAQQFVSRATELRDQANQAPNN